MPIAIVTAVVVILLVAVAIFSMNQPSSRNQQTAGEQTAPSPATNGESMTPTEAPAAMTAVIYKDGVYEATGEYTSPGGEESIDVTLTLKNDIVEDAEVESNATRPISKQMQASFIEGYKEMVVGKKISEINLGKVSKSSLAPKGFNDAVEKIKEEAKA